MLKIKDIKSIEDFKNYNIICTNADEIIDCLNILNNENITENDIDDGCIVITYNYDYKQFCNRYLLDGLKKNINYYQFKKRYNYLKKKEKVEQKDFETDSKGRITKINNFESDKKVYYYDCLNNYSIAIEKIKDIAKFTFSNLIDDGLIYDNHEELINKTFKMQIETKLENIAERLNKGKDIDWGDEEEQYYICYDFDDDKLDLEKNIYFKSQGTIYCLDEEFLEVAKKEIGEEELIKYFKGII